MTCELVLEQVKEQDGVSRTTTTHTRPVRSKPGVPLRNMLLSGIVLLLTDLSEIKLRNALMSFLSPQGTSFGTGH